jgi:hypothetical protein
MIAAREHSDHVLSPYAASDLAAIHFLCISA